MPVLMKFQSGIDGSNDAAHYLRDGRGDMVYPVGYTARIILWNVLDQGALRVVRHASMHVWCFLSSSKGPLLSVLHM